LAVTSMPGSSATEVTDTGDPDRLKYVLLPGVMPPEKLTVPFELLVGTREVPGPS